MGCLAKDPAARPASAAVLSERLAATVPVDAWTFDTAQAWWERHQPVGGRRPRADIGEPLLGNAIKFTPEGARGRATDRSR